ncbi:unnamed protein product [Calypogeia fissa]
MPCAAAANAGGTSQCNEVAEMSWVGESSAFALRILLDKAPLEKTVVMLFVLLGHEVLPEPAAMRCNAAEMECRNGMRGWYLYAAAMRLGFTPSCRVQGIILVWLFVTLRPSHGDGKNDQLCLNGLKEGFLPGDNANLLTRTWTGSDFPCNGNSTYMGIVCSSLRVIEIQLTGMNLEGTISTSISSCDNLGTLDLSDNQLTGSIPSGVGQLVQLTNLNLSANSLSGSIPEFLKAIYINTLDLHNNKLSGDIPTSLGSLQRLRAFDVSNNDLQGPIPYTLSNTSTGSPRFNITSFQGNKGLYGYPLPTPKNHNLSVLAIVGIGLGSGMLSLILSFTAVCIWLRVTEQKNAAEEGKISQLMPDDEP